MGRAAKIFFGFLAVIILIPLTTGCVRPSSCIYSEAPAGEIFLSPNPNFEEASFSKWAGQSDQNDRIRYLLERTAASNGRFIRNGQAHNGRKARIWLLYKMGHWVSGVATAEDFVAKVATFSQKTGEPYLIQTPDGQFYSLGSVFKNELLAFDNQQNKLKAAPIPLSTAAVATTAVAANTSS